MEVQEKEVRIQSKITSQTSRYLETPKEENEFKVQSSFAKFVAEKESGMEKKNEASQLSEMALRRLRLGPRRCFSSQDPRIKLLFRLGVCGRRQLQGINE